MNEHLGSGQLAIRRFYCIMVPISVIISSVVISKRNVALKWSGILIGTSAAVLATLPIAVKVHGAD
jgi:hypothetical protein